MLSSINVLQISHAEITTPDLYESVSVPVMNGPLDLRMGVGNKSMVCLTCDKSLEQCLGHFGHARLSLPIYHIGYFKHLLLILKMVCKYCYQVLLEREVLNDYRMKMERL